jgi:hypothetical protein
MTVLEFINGPVFKTINTLLDVIFLFCGLLGIWAYFIRFYINGRKKEVKENIPRGESDLTLQTVLLFLFCMIGTLFWVIPEISFGGPLFLGNGSLNGWTRQWLDRSGLFSTLRLFEVFGIVFLFAWMSGKEHGEKRWLYSALGNIAVILLGWLIQRWIGCIFISVPILAAYYFSLYSLAGVTLPVADPESRAEKRKRFLILLSYTWGFQRPIMVAGEHAWKKPITRIPGVNSPGFPVPGMVWAQAHQVVGITGGTQFKRVDGPGVVYTQKKERPLQILDLRLQARTNEIDVVSKDGINFKARVATAFCLDPENWDQELYNKIRNRNSLLRGANQLSYTKGSFKFSHLRIQAAIGKTSSNAGGDAAIYWDQWVLSVIEETARQIISQKELMELWHLAEDKKGDNALEGIAEELKAKASLTLRAQGILLVSSRIVDFSFPVGEGKADVISEQQVLSRSSEWEKKRIEILAEAQAVAERTQLEAHAFAESLLLTSIAEGLKKTAEINENLPRAVIAMRYLSALQDYIHKQPLEAGPGSAGDGMKEISRKMKDLQTTITEWQNKNAPPADKEK